MNFKNSFFQRGTIAKRKWIERLSFIVIGMILSQLLHHIPGKTQNVEATPVGKNEVKETSVEQNHVYDSFSEEDIHSAIQNLGKLVQGINSWDEKDFQRCKLKNIGTGFGMHKICENLLKKTYTFDCAVLSYGIANDYSFDTEIQERTGKVVCFFTFKLELTEWFKGCNVFALDPTVSHNSALAPHVYFLEFAAPTESLIETNWVYAPITKMANLVAPKQIIPVLKMDCEGCEYSIVKDVLENDNKFFYRVTQFALELHLSKIWMKTDNDFLNFGKLLKLLEISGLQLAHAVS